MFMTTVLPRMRNEHHEINYLRWLLWICKKEHFKLRNSHYYTVFPLCGLKFFVSTTVPVLFGYQAVCHVRSSTSLFSLPMFWTQLHFLIKEVKHEKRKLRPQSWYPELVWGRCWAHTGWVDGAECALCEWTALSVHGVSGRRWARTACLYLCIQEVTVKAVGTILQCKIRKTNKLNNPILFPIILIFI